VCDVRCGGMHCVGWAQWCVHGVGCAQWVCTKCDVLSGCMYSAWSAQFSGCVNYNVWCAQWLYALCLICSVVGGTACVACTVCDGLSGVCTVCDVLIGVCTVGVVLSGCMRCVGCAQWMYVLYKKGSWLVCTACDVLSGACTVCDVLSGDYTMCDE
jgi:hypothetical protein